MSLNPAKKTSLRPLRRLLGGETPQAVLPVSSSTSTSTTVSSNRPPSSVHTSPASAVVSSVAKEVKVTQEIEAKTNIPAATAAASKVD